MIRFKYFYISVLDIWEYPNNYSENMSDYKYFL